MERICIVVIIMLAGLMPSEAQSNDFFTFFEANNQSYALNVAKQSIQVSSNICNNKQRVLALFDTNQEHRTVAKILTEIFESQNISQADVWVNLTVTHDPVSYLYTHSWGREVFEDVWNPRDPDANCVKYPDICCARMSWESQVYVGLKDSSCYTAYYFLCGQERLCPSANCSHGCKENATHYTCTCRDGYTLAADRMSCQEVDQCNCTLCTGTAEGNSTLCTSTHTHITCSTGHTLSTNDTTCLDIDECVSSPCQYQCNNTVGSYYCTCPIGHTLSTNGTACLDIDECQGTNQCQSVCTNTPGSYLCGCHHGYQDINKSCVDVDECVVGHHNCSQTCHNFDGGYTCSCHQGYTTPDDNRFQCHDIDECHNDSTCQHTCVNTGGSSYCTCNKGYELDPENRSCHDIDECQLNTTLCEHFCNNTPGSFYCSCPQGFTIDQDGRSCAMSYRKCPCLCSHLTRDDVKLTHNMEAMRQDLVLNLRSLSAFTRSKTSNEDRRTTARSLGCVGLVFMVTVVILLAGLDAFSFGHILYTRSRHRGHG